MTTTFLDFFLVKAMKFFKNSLNELIEMQFADHMKNKLVPKDFLINHISSSFVELVLWWIKGGMKQNPVELDGYFLAVIEPIL